MINPTEDYGLIFMNYYTNATFNNVRIEGTGFTNNTNLILGEISKTLGISDIEESDYGSYTVELRDGIDFTVSNEAIISEGAEAGARTNLTSKLFGRFLWP